MRRHRRMPSGPLWIAILSCMLVGSGCYLLDDDLTLPAWGPYAPDQIGATYIHDVEEGKAAVFPIVVGQANGTDETRNLVLYSYWWEDIPPRMRTWKVLGVDADSELTYWAYRILFRETGNLDWTVQNLPGWDQGEARVECARLDEDIIVAITFLNGDDTETYRYFADILGGYDPVHQSLPAGDTVVGKDTAQGWMTLEHPGAPGAFAVMGTGAPEVHLFDIRDAYYHPGVVTGTNGLGMHDDGTYTGDGDGWWLDMNLSSVEVPPGEERTVYGVIKRGPDAAAAVTGASALLADVENEMAAARQRYEQTRYHVSNPAYSDFIGHAVSQILVNTVFHGAGDMFRIPLDRRFFTPSRYYSSYHNWDTGCMTLGMMEYDHQLAWENLDTALPDLDPWFRLGQLSPTVPTPVFALWEIYELTHDRSALQYLYPAARDWYLFSVQQGREGDDDWLLDWGGEGPNGEADIYGYGSGMDDLPVWVHAKTAGPGGTLRHVEAPCMQSLFYRAARLLRMMAEELGGHEADIVEYGYHLEQLRMDLQNHMWDPVEGIFTPVWLDDDSPVEGYEQTILGVYPLLGGRDFVTEYQKDRMIEYMTDEDTLWSGFGVRTVSRSAPYYYPYLGWWGGVWVPCQWFLWKGLLSFGEIDLARELAWQVLENHRMNHEEKSYLVEVADGETGLSSNAKDFTGLSSPVINLYACYNTPGRFTTGWDVRTHAVVYDEAQDTLRCMVSAPDLPGESGFVAVMGQPGTVYRLHVLSETHDYVSDETGAVSFVADVGFDPMEVRLERLVAP